MNGEPNKYDKQRYKNGEYLNDIRIVYTENPADDPNACFFVTCSVLMFRVVNSESIQYLRSKFARLLDYQRLVTAHEPDLTMERFATVSTMNPDVKVFPEEMVKHFAFER